MCCLAEVGMLIFGIIALVKGSFSLTRTRVVRGAAARVIGVVLMLPLPVSFGVGLVIGIVLAQGGQPVDITKLSPYAGIDAALVLVCLLTALVIALASAKSPIETLRPTDLPPPPRQLDHSNPYKLAE